MDVVFFDKDRTLGEFGDGERGLYPNVDDFLGSQRQLGRKLYVATTAGDGSQQHLGDISDKLDGYFGSQQINSGREGLYILSDGQIRKIRDDYTERIDFESEERRKELDDEPRKRAGHLFALPLGSEEREALQREVNDFFRYWHQLLHKETRKSFDESTVYRNPHLDGGGHSKDLYLAGRLIAPVGYEDLRTVMVGDYGDRGVPASNPETPLIVISKNVREGNWRMVSLMLDRLFANGSMPWQVYEEMFAQSTPREDGTSNSFSLGGLEFVLERGDNSERRVYCP